MIVGASSEDVDSERLMFTEKRVFVKNRRPSGPASWMRIENISFSVAYARPGRS